MSENTFLNWCVSWPTSIESNPYSLSFSPAATLRTSSTSLPLPNLRDTVNSALPLRRCRTHPSLRATMICCPYPRASPAGKKTPSNPSSSSTCFHLSGSSPGLPANLTPLSSASHHPSSNPNVRCVNKLQLVISFSTTIPCFFSSAFAFRNVSRIFLVACSTLLATTTSYAPASIPCPATVFDTSKIAVRNPVNRPPYCSSPCIKNAFERSV